MTPAVLDRPGSLFDDAAACAPQSGAPEGACAARSAAPEAASPARAAVGARPFGGRLTLEERLDALLQATRVNGSADCPVCHARMSLTRALTRAHAECTGCGSRLS